MSNFIGFGSSELLTAGKVTTAKRVPPSFLVATADGRLAALSLLISRDFQSELLRNQRLILGR